MRIHAIKTGAMQVKRRYVQAAGKNRLVRLTSALLDSEWRTIPIYTWVIEHPEGLIVVDTGETAAVHDLNYFPLWQRPYWATQYRFLIQPEDQLGAQLRQRGLSPEDVRWVLLTHTHFDHTDGINAFPRSEILLSRREYEDTFRFRSAHFAFPARWSPDLKLRPIDYQPHPLGAFEHSYPVTHAGDVLFVPTPGHTSGHQSVVLREGESVLFFGGDASFDLPSLLSGTMDAPAVNAEQDYQTRARILATARQMPLVYLTTHDPDTPNRLEQRQPLDSAAEAITL